ncbi:MAG: sulfatase-like hydrolase/transferase, partial [bacterium]|nr:sulfatase-like hydrolase/transferase [bacterium]
GTLMVGSELQGEQWLMSLFIIFLFAFILPFLALVCLKGLKKVKVPLRWLLPVGFIIAAVFLGSTVFTPVSRDSAFTREVPSPLEFTRGRTKQRGPKNRPNILLIVMDTARTASMSLYGYEKSTTPFLQEFSADAVLFKNAISSSPWTLPSHATLFTGLPASLHFATHGESEANPIVPLAPGYDTLAEMLCLNGYKTGAVIANTGVLSPRFGLSQGFGYYWW